MKLPFKTLSLALIGATAGAPGAWGSHWMSWCSDETGQVRMIADMAQPWVLSIRLGEEPPVEYRRGLLDIETVTATEISRKVTGCEGVAPGTGSVVTDTVVMDEEVIIRLKEGERFPAGTPGVSEDGLTIRLNFECRHAAGGPAMCP